MNNNDEVARLSEKEVNGEVQVVISKVKNRVNIPDGFKKTDTRDGCYYNTLTENMSQEMDND